MNAIFLLLPIIALAACASPRIIIDKQGVDMNQYEQDLAECRQYAEEIDTAAEAAKGAVGGAVIGGAVGGILGGRSSAEKLGAVAAVTGAARGGSSAGREKIQVIKNCLRGRGYKILN